MDYLLGDWLLGDWLSDHRPLAGACLAAIIALIAWWGDRRRLRRRDLDRVGIMPWRTLSFWAMLCAALLVAAAIHGP